MRDEDGCAAETAAEICAESAGVCGRIQCRLKRVMCRDLSETGGGFGTAAGQQCAAHRGA